MQAATRAASGGKDVAPDWEASPPKPLTATEAALVVKLYELCDSADGLKGDGIQISRLSRLETSAGGPHTVKLCAELANADVSKDGVVTLDELTKYFTSAARFLSEAEFRDILGGLIDSAASMKLASGSAKLNNAILRSTIKWHVQLQRVRAKHFITASHAPDDVMSFAGAVADGHASMTNVRRQGSLSSQPSQKRMLSRQMTSASFTARLSHRELEEEEGGGSEGGGSPSALRKSESFRSASSSSFGSPPANRFAKSVEMGEGVPLSHDLQ